jgi:hypothetical protein
MKRLSGQAFVLILALTSGLTVACSDDPSGPESSPLAGFSQQQGRDSVGNSLPPAPSVPTAGGFHGTVLAPSGSHTPGQDTLATAPRIAGVVVNAYKWQAGSYEGDKPVLGALEQTVTTGADGKFALDLSGGDYVVSFTPPANSEYGGVYVTASTSANSNQWPWWVILWKK